MKLGKQLTRTDLVFRMHRHEENKLIEIAAMFNRLLDILKDDTLAIKIARDCFDPAHDDRWCSTCEARIDGIEAYREYILGFVEEE